MQLGTIVILTLPLTYCLLRLFSKGIDFCLRIAKGLFYRGSPIALDLQLVDKSALRQNLLGTSNRSKTKTTLTHPLILQNLGVSLPLG